MTTGWKKDIEELCIKFGAAPVITAGTWENIQQMYIASPKELSAEEQEAIAKHVPVGVICEFKVCPLDWKGLLNRICARYNVEPVISKRDMNEAIKTLQFNCPKQLTEDERTAIIGPVPQGIEMLFNVTPKQSTIGNLRTVLLVMGAKVDSVSYDIENRTLEINGHGLVIPGSLVHSDEDVNMGEILPQLPQQIWDKISSVLKLDGAIDSCKLSCDSLNLDLDVKNAPDDVHSSDAEVDEAVMRVRETLEASKTLPKSKAVPASEKKPERDICPTKDEITNLTIDLENAKSIDDVLRLMGADPTQK